MTNQYIRKITYPSVIMLIGANFIPLIGVLFFDWSLFQILFLYWIESAVIGFYNVFKMIKLSGPLSIFIVPFFIVHYGGFMAGHLVFIFALFSPDKISVSFFPQFDIVVSLLKDIAIPLVFLFLSHGMSFMYNFIGKKEYKRTNIGKQMHAPYKRILLMHLTLIFGGWIVMVFNAPIFGLVVLIVFKLFMDIHAHIKEHTGLQSITLS